MLYNVSDGVHLHVRTCTSLFQISQTAGRLANGWEDCVQILFVARDPLDTCFTHV